MGRQTRRAQPRGSSGPEAPAASSATEPWVSVEQAALHLGVKKISVYRWIETRGLPARKIGKLWKLKVSDVDAWVRARGASDTIETPVRVPAPTPAQTDRSAKTPLRKKGGSSGARKKRVVLVIDDDELVRDSVGDFLTDKGYVVRFASTGAQALELLGSTPHPHVILLDLKMPQLDGWTFRERQLSAPELASIPVIVVTATADPRLNGAAAVLRKPLRLPHLARAVDVVFNQVGETS